MGLSVKLALVICLAVTGGTCWLVNQVARPILNVGSPLTGGSAKGGDALSVRAIAERFARASAVTPARDGAATTENLESTVVRETLPTAHPVERDTLPPLVLGVSREYAGAEVAPGGVDGASGAARDEVLTPTGGRGGPILLMARGGDPAAPATDSAARAPESLGVDMAREYVVRPGDSLTKICKAQLGSDAPDTLRSMLAANPALKGRANLVFAGQKLALPATGAGVAGAAAAARETPVAKNAPPAARITTRSGSGGATAKASGKTASAKSESAKPGAKTVAAKGGASKPTGAKPASTKAAAAKSSGASAKSTERDKPSGTNGTVRTASAEPETGKRDGRKSKTARPG